MRLEPLDYGICQWPVESSEDEKVLKDVQLILCGVGSSGSLEKMADEDEGQNPVDSLQP